MAEKLGQTIETLCKYCLLICKNLLCLKTCYMKKVKNCSNTVNIKDSKIIKTGSKVEYFCYIKQDSFRDAPD